MDRIGQMIHKRYAEQFRNEVLQMSINEHFADIVEPFSYSFKVKVGREDWMIYVYIPINEREYQWFREGNMPTNYVI